MARLADKVAIVTGGGFGIGRAIAAAFAAEGARVAVLDRDGEAAGASAQALGGLGIAVDVGEAPAVHEAVAEVQAAFGRVDLLVNNAGVSPAAPFLELDDAAFDACLRVNLMGVVHGCRAVLPQMIERRSGAVINMSSWLGKAGRPIFSAYCASKFAVLGLAQALAHEMAPHGIRVNAICPGIIGETRMRAEIERVQERLGLPGTAERVAAIPQRRAGRPQEVAAVALFLASDEASYMTGEAVNVGGGLWMH